MKLQGKGLNAPVLWTVIGAVQIICFHWKKEALSLLTSPTLWSAFVFLILYLLLCIYNRCSPPRENWKKSSWSCVSLEAQAKASESDSRVTSSSLSDAKTPKAMCKAAF